MTQIKINDELIEKDFRSMILEAEERLLSMPSSWQGAELDKHCPLKHSFGDGCYIREIFMPAGTLIVSKIHKITHPYFVMKGKASVLTDEGVVVIEAPFQGMTQAGTKRALYIHEEMTWITVHVTNETDLEKIEEEIIAKDFDELDGNIREVM